MADNDQAAADKDAVARRKADLKAAADRLAARRAAEDDARAQARVAEDDALADVRRDEDRRLASARGRVADAAAALDAVAETGDLADLRAVNAELQAAIQAHLDEVPEVVEVPAT
jgi:hypothetical protein